MADADGHLPFFVITGIIGAVAGAVIGAVATRSVKGALIGAAAGALVGVGLGAVAGVLLAGSATATTTMVVAGGSALINQAGNPVTTKISNVVSGSRRGVPATQATASKAVNSAPKVTKVISRAFNADQNAIIQLAKENKAGISRQNANILVDWAKEYGINNHGPDTHTNRSGIWSYTEHIKIFNQHIPVLPD